MDTAALWSSHGDNLTIILQRGEELIPNVSVHKASDVCQGWRARPWLSLFKWCACAHACSDSHSKRLALTCVYVAFDPSHFGMQGWRSGESTHLQPIWPEFNFQSQMWTEFFGSLLCTERFSPDTPVFPLLKTQHLTWFLLIVISSLQCPQLVLQR